MKLESIMKNSELSLRQISLNLDVNYNMLLKYSKKPIIGIPYDPTFVNYEEIERYLISKLTQETFDSIDWNSMKESSDVSNISLPSNITLGSRLRLRMDDNIYEVRLITSTHICILPIDGTQPRLFSIPTFIHQGPKVIK